ncbi:MAG: hypothetical protein HQL96_01560 [Magnetococcales bacterium]|nr:hypothetical protein [Magnetococcales bacterium]
MNEELQALILAQLERPRSVMTRIDPGLGGLLHAQKSAPGEALSGPVFKLEEYLQELLLSRHFTPGDGDRVACEAVLPDGGLSGEAVAGLVAALLAQLPACPMTVGERSGFLPLPEVVIARYVRLLALDAPLDPRAAALIAGWPVGERSQARALCRRPVWREPGRGEMLLDALRAISSRDRVSAEKLDFLTHFVRTYRCGDLPALRRGLEALVEAYRIDSEHPTYNPRLETKQAESIRSHNCDENVRRFRVAMAREILEELFAGGG